MNTHSRYKMTTRNMNMAYTHFVVTNCPRRGIPVNNPWILASQISRFEPMWLLFLEDTEI